MSAPLIEAHGLTRVYPMGDSQVLALAGVDLTVQAGEFVALMGASGSGKSTLLHLLGCLDRPTAGTFCLDGQDVGRLSVEQRARLRNRSIGFVFQTFNLLPDLTALENVTLPLLYRRDALDARERAWAALRRVGLARRAGHRPNQLSGGERQRVAIARALVGDPALILADEPTGNLDRSAGEQVLAFLSHLNGEGRTIVLVTHDAAIAGGAGRVLMLRDGVIATG